MILHWPLPAVYQRITSTHGPTGNDGQSHVGIDISCPIGTPVYAAHDGIVRYEWTQAGGNCIRLTAPSGEYTRYCHLSSYTTGDYEQVAAGDEIARSGNSGLYTTGAHLHFELHLAGGFAVDPLEYLRREMSKLSLHFQNVTDWAKDVTSRYWPYRTTGGWVKCINPPVPDVFPDTHVLGRAYWHPDNNNWEAQCVARGAAGAEEYFNYHLPYYQERRGAVTAWEAVNEPNLTTLPAAYNYADFLNSWNALMHAAGFKTCGGSIAVGNPQLAVFNDTLGDRVIGAIAQALCQCNYWSYHAYWDGRYNPNDNWWAHRYREIYNAIRAKGYIPPKLIISECGCDHAGGKYDGWRARGITWEQYFSDCRAFDKELQKDAYVEAATIFTSGANEDWINFLIDLYQAEGIGAYRMGELPSKTLEQTIGEIGQKNILPLNLEAALEKYGAAMGLLPASGEFDISYGGVNYRCQAYRKPEERAVQYWLYCKDGDWGNIKHFTRPN